MKKTKCVLIALMIVAMLSSMVACAAPAPAATQAPAADAAQPTAEVAEAAPADAAAPVEKPLPKIGFIVQDVANEYMSNSIIGAEAYCGQRGIDLTVFDGAGSSEKQVTGMENLMNAGCDIIDLRALDEKAVYDSIKEATSKGILVNTYPDIDVSTTVLKYDDYDQGYKLGVEGANWINEKLGGSAKVAYLTQPQTESVMLRVDGFNDALTALCPGAEVVAEVAGYLPDTGMSATESILQANPDVRVFLCVADAGAMGCSEAIESSGVAIDDFFVGGVDGNDAAIQKIADPNSCFRCSIAGELLIPDITYNLLDNIVKAYNGEEYDRNFVVPVMAVTAENVEAYNSRTPILGSK